MHRSFDFERMARERRAQEAKQEQMKQDWLLLTGENMNAKDLERLYRDWGSFTGTHMTPNNFERLQFSWSLLTRNMDSAEFAQVIQNMTTSDLEDMRKDYLILNWMKMSWKDFELFKENWLKIAASTGVDNGEDIVKNWLLNMATDIFHMSYEEKVEYIRICLERGADVNAVDHGGYSLLHMVSSNDAVLMELLLSFGADVTLRCPQFKGTVLEDVRTRYYKDHEDAVSLLMTAEKYARKMALKKRINNQEAIPINDSFDTSLELNLSDEKFSELNQLEGSNNSKCRKLNEAQKSVEASQSPYLTRLTELFDIVELDDIGSLTVRVINYMYVSRIIKTELKFKNRINRNEKIRKMHQVFSRVCTKLFNLFDPEFDKPVNIEFGDDAMLSETADLVFLLDIDPEVEWVAVNMFAVPWDMEYHVSCKTSSISRFTLDRAVRNPSSYCMSDLIYEYSPHMGEYQRRLIDWNEY